MDWKDTKDTEGWGDNGMQVRHGAGIYRGKKRRK